MIEGQRQYAVFTKEPDTGEPFMFVDQHSKNILNFRFGLTLRFEQIDVLGKSITYYRSRSWVDKALDKVTTDAKAMGLNSSGRPLKDRPQ